MEILEYEGIWEIPKYSDSKFYGKLIISNEYINLKIIGEFPLELDNISPDIIHGYSQNGKEITLLNNFKNGGEYNYPGFDTYNYSSQFAIIGRRYYSTQEIKFKSICADYTNLIDWVDISGFTEKRQINKMFEVDMNYKIPNVIEHILAGYKLNICFRANRYGDFKSEYILKHGTYIKFDNLEECSLKEAQNIIHDFSEFLTLCIGRNIKPYNILAKDYNNTKIEIYINSNRYSNIDDSKIIHNNIFIPYRYIDTDLETCLIAWISKKEKLQPIINYLIESCDIKIYEPIIFIKVMQALETFSRRMMKNYKDDPSYHEERIKCILSSIKTEEYKIWLEDRLKFSNEPNLNKRLKEIFKETEFILKMNSKKREYICRKLVYTRNYYTHFDESMKDKKMNTSELLWTTKYIIILLKVLIMKELGIDEQKIKSRLNEVYSERYVINKFSEIFDI